MAVLRLFAAARDAAGTGRDTIEGSTVGEVIAAACSRYGDDFVRLLPTCRVWLNGDQADDDMAVDADDEVAVLPPVSGG